MKFESNLPIYVQIFVYLKRQIITGSLNVGFNLPSVI